MQFNVLSIWLSLVEFLVDTELHMMVSVAVTHSPVLTEAL